jgi:signal recognition particle subunit SRP72
MMGRADDALAACDSGDGSSALGMGVERAYALYRLKRYREAQAALDGGVAKDQEQRTAALRAQLAYRTERFGDAARMYKELARTTPDSEKEEVTANLCAALVEAGDRDACRTVIAAASGSTLFESAFNVACHHSACGEWAAAKSALDRARKLAAGAQDPEAALCTVDAQAAYVDAQTTTMAQAAARQAVADKFSEVLQRAKQGSETAVVAANNAAAMHPVTGAGGDVLSSQCTVADARLSSHQRAAVAWNKALLALAAANRAELDEALAAYRAVDPSATAADRAAVVSALGAGPQDADVLQAFSRLSSSSTVGVLGIMAHAQVLSKSGAHAAAADLLERGLPAAFRAKPGVCAAIAALCDKAGDGEGAARALEDCAERNKEQEAVGRRVAEALARRGHHARASAVFEACACDSKPDPSRVEALAMVNPSRAEQLCKTLPPLPSLAAGVTVEVLESLAIRASTVVVDPSAAPAGGQGQQGMVAVAKKMRKRHKKRKIPEGANKSIPPNPERWIPKRDRAGFKAKRNRRRDNLSKGVQGAQNPDVERQLGQRSQAPAAPPAIAAASSSGGKRFRRPRRK